MNDTATLRGDYRNIGPDYAVWQDWDAYTPQEHALYRRLYERQSALVPRLASPVGALTVRCRSEGRVALRRRHRR